LPSGHVLGAGSGIIVARSQNAAAKCVARAKSQMQIFSAAAAFRFRMACCSRGCSSLSWAPYRRCFTIGVNRLPSKDRYRWRRWCVWARRGLKGHQRALNVQESGTVGQRRGFLRMARVAGSGAVWGTERRASVRQV